MKPKQENLLDHILITYNYIRLGVAIIGILLPILLVIFGKISGVEWQNSISAYFHAQTDGFLLRTLFVGCLFSIGVALVLYQGFSKLENRLLNVAGVFAVFVAAFPMTWTEADGNVIQGVELFQLGKGAVSMHHLSAVIFFVCIAMVCWSCASETLIYLTKGNKTYYKNIYKSLGIAMVALPITAFVLTLFFGISNKAIFWIEVAAIFVFAAYWVIKSIEIKNSLPYKPIKD